MGAISFGTAQIPKKLVLPKKPKVKTFWESEEECPGSQKILIHSRECIFENLCLRESGEATVC